MPSLSTPRSALGARFTKTVTCLPMISSGLKLSAMPETIVRVSIPVSTLRTKSFLVFGIFSASKIVPTRKSILVKSSKFMVSFCGIIVLFSDSLTFFVASSLFSCACISSSSTFRNSNSGSPIWRPLGRRDSFFVTSGQESSARSGF